MSELIYLYCLTMHKPLPPIEGTGLDDQSPLSVQAFEDVAAIVSLVRAEEFIGPEAESRMQDLSWVGPRACRHAEVVNQIARHSPVLPIPFGTIFSSRDSLERRLNRHYRPIHEFLDQVADKEEWAVKGVLDRAKAREGIQSGVLSRKAASLRSLSPGTRHLEERRVQASVENELSEWLKETSKRMANELGRFAHDSRERRSPCGQGDSAREMIWNWAFLIPRTNAEDLRAAIDRENAGLAERGLVFELTGPWPPYSFTPSLVGDCEP